jgi:hypothetical protein
MKGLARFFNWLKNTEKGVLLVLFLYAFLVRLPFFFRDYIDRDESTFILMGQSWVDGHLPFTELWDIKPPLTFFFFAIPIYLFGKSFIAIRFFGVLFVTISSFYTYKLSAANNKKIALVVGLLAVSLQSMFGSLQGVMSEHISIAFLVPAIWLLTKNKTSFWKVFVSGLLVGIALMVKLNLAYVALFIGLFLVYTEYQKNKSIQLLLKPIIYGTGIILTILLTFLPYYIDDLGMLWWDSVIQAPLAYAGARQYSSLKLLLYLLPFFLLLFVGWKKKIFNLKNRTVLLLIIATIGMLVAFIKGGRVNGHYLILIYPFILPLLALIDSEITKFRLPKPGLIIGILFLLIPIESYLEYIAVFKNKIENDTFFNGEGISVPNYFVENNLDKENILYLEYHIGYWVMSINPPTKSAIQPSNILKDEMFFAYDNPRETGEQELKYIIEQERPSFIITRKNRRIFDKKEVAVNFYINLQLLQNYTPLDTVEGAVIHQRLKRK